MKNDYLISSALSEISERWNKTLLPKPPAYSWLTTELNASELLTQQIIQAQKSFSPIQNSSLFFTQGIIEANKNLEATISSHIDQMFKVHDALKDATISMSGGILGMQRAMEEAASRFIGPIREIADFGQQFAIKIEKFSDPLLRLSESIAAMQDAAFSHLSRLPANFDILWTRYYEIEKRAFKLFAELGLTGLEFSLTANDFQQILEIHSEQGNDAALDCIFGLFKEDEFYLLNQFVAGWQDTPYMADRLKAINGAIAAHKRGEYELTISTLLPMIDGLSALIVAHIPNPKRKTIRVTDAVLMFKDIEPDISSECLVRVVENVLFRDVNLRQTQTAPSPNNRHAILHGRVANFGTELCSYQVILLLGAMVHISQKMQHAVIV